ncbi:MAG TPA: ABC transporter permease subunit [Candidatus Hydrogenedentes bacterium]|nr:ABC transporter permease subunit [Candidatus Hydrogenedentota bacterium]HOV74610.1 ABC transporter permease subunit [Candidatus Hydrogenedentota bacterium]HPC15496.1 ABC transporter permease subunit [Candidatus Hydrogenedentota bacterium]HRT20227.1 ABC transporter permease subunit [Candidatus Hydrogenedentota bacterium]HRT64289.1 ABC transporter permease subunit [Candidatus Hydrogenedentota bacterium]
MRNTWAVCKREFASYFLTPIGYVVVGTYALISGLGFSASFLFYAKVSVNPSEFAYSGVPSFTETLLSPFLVFCGMLVMFIGPLVTMRLLAEERNRGTMELLLTHPLRDREIVFGKFGAALGMLLVMMAVIGVYLGIMAYYATVAADVLLFGLLAVFLMGTAFMSLGLFVSAMAGNQITAGTMTFGLSLVLYILGTLGENLPKKNPAPDTWPETLRNAAGTVYGVFREAVQQLPLDAHAKEMAKGILQPEDIAYYLLVSAFFLFLTFRAIESRKWRA